MFKLKTTRPCVALYVLYRAAQCAPRIYVITVCPLPFLSACTRLVSGARRKPPAGTSGKDAELPVRWTHTPLALTTEVVEKRPLPAARKSPGDPRRGNVLAGNYTEIAKDVTEDSSSGSEVNRRSFPRPAARAASSTGNLTALPPSMGINQNRLQSTSQRMLPISAPPPIDDTDESSLTPAQRYSFNLKKKEESFKAELLLNREESFKNEVLSTISKDAIPPPPKDSSIEPRVPFVSDRQSGRDLDKWREMEKRKSQDGADPSNAKDPTLIQGLPITTLSSATLSARNRPTRVVLSRGNSVDGASLYGALVASAESPEQPGPLSLFRSFPPSDTSSNAPGTPYYEEHSITPPPERINLNEQILHLDNIYSEGSAFDREGFNSSSSKNNSNNTDSHGSNNFSANVDTHSYPLALSPMSQLNNSKFSEQARANQQGRLSRTSSDGELKDNDRL
jgi:hypothetical protein